MAIVGIRQLSRETSNVIQEFERTKEPVIVTREGKPIGALVPVDEQQVEETFLASLPEMRERHESAVKELEGGQARSIEEVAAERGIELGGAGDPAEEGEPPSRTSEVGEEPAVPVVALREASEAELAPLREILMPAVAGRIMSGANEDIARLSADALEGIGEDQEGEEPSEVAALTARLYGHYFRQRFLRAMARSEGAAEAIDSSRHWVTRRMRAINRVAVASELDSIGEYRAFLAHARLVVDADEEEAASDARAEFPLEG
jgi:prevent-host-death family protein